MNRSVPRAITAPHAFLRRFVEVETRSAFAILGSAVLGVTWAPGPVRIGASVSTPFALSGTAAIRVRSPSAAAFDGTLVRTRAGVCADVDDATVAA